MKELNLFSHVFMESTESIPVDQESAVLLTKAAHENRKKVIAAALFIEREIEAIIGFYLFPGPDVTEEQAFVAGEILGSDAVSFSHKRRLIRSLVNRKHWLQGEAKNAFDKGLQKWISLRNAFAHGNFVVLGSSVFLEYFEGERKKPELTDAYLSDVESSFHQLVAHIEAIKKEAGMRRDPIAAA